MSDIEKIIEFPIEKLDLFNLDETTKYSVLLFVAFTHKSADKSILLFSTVYVTLTLSPFAFNPFTFIVAFVSSVIAALAKVASDISGVPVNITLKFDWLGSATAVPVIFNVIFWIAAYPIPSKSIAIKKDTNNILFKRKNEGECNQWVKMHYN